MATAKSLRRQAATCANLAKETNDEESRERYIRLQRLYLQLADGEEPSADHPAPIPGTDNSDPNVHRPF